VHYLSGRGDFHTPRFRVNRFVLLSSRDSVGGGPYLTEEIFPLNDISDDFSLVARDAHPSESML
jgi:RNA 2',3'-cyclic 3'-phosphodiesterase